MSRFEQLVQRSLDQPEAFWAEEAKRIHWKNFPSSVLDPSNPPFARWFSDGVTNLCFNAIDRHLKDRGNQSALIYVSTETGVEESYTYADLHKEVQCVAAILKALGVQTGDRVLIYMPLVPQAVFAMLACARIGAIHSVVFGGFASAALATRIDDAQPKLVFSADAGSRAGRVIPYKPLLDEAIRLAEHKPKDVVLVDRGLSSMEWTAERDHDYAALRERHLNASVECEWVESNHPSYILYTSGTTGMPKGVQRDTGGQATSLVASMEYIFNAHAGETFFATSDIGWQVGHSYIVYGPLLAGMSTILYEGVPIRPDAAVWWRIVEQYRVNVMFSAPTAIRVLKKHDAALLRRHDLSSLKALFLAGEPLDEPTAKWISEGLGVSVIDNYWQTESGWPILGIATGADKRTAKFGSPGVPMYGYRVKLLDESSGSEIHAPGERGIVAIEGPTPPGFMQTIWRDDKRFVDTYWRSIEGRLVYNTFDWGVRDADGYYYILGRTDDVINVAGHRLGTREIEECISAHPEVAEVAVVGVADQLKGQVAIAVIVSHQPIGSSEGASEFERQIKDLVDARLGAVARPARIHLVTALPKTRSGKLVRRVIQALAENRDPGDLSTIEDQSALQQVQQAMYVD